MNGKQIITITQVPGLLENVALITVHVYILKKRFEFLVYPCQAQINNCVVCMMG